MLSLLSDFLIRSLDVWQALFQFTAMFTFLPAGGKYLFRDND